MQAALELAQVRGRLQAGEPLVEADRVALLEVLQLAQSGPNRRQGRVARRNELIRELARIHFPNLRPGAQAARIAALARRYHGTAWVRDCRHATLPDRLQGRAERLLWLAFKTVARFPFSYRQIERILK